METGKPGLVSAPVHISSVAAQTEKRMDIQAPLTAVYIHTVPALPAQPFPQPPAAARESPALHLAMPPLYSKETLPFLTLHIAGGLQSQPGLSLAAAAPAARPKSAGKHVCPHCGRDCMKPSVLEKHLRCHTGERPYPCTICGVSFKTQSNLYKHKRTQAHARLSSESEQSSLDSISNSRETCTSSLSLDERGEETGSLEKDTALPAAEITSPASTAKVCSVKTSGSVSEQNEMTPAGHKPEPHEKRNDEKLKMENENPSVPASRHLPLQRQEATLFSKQWESSVARGKSQSHESTDSGFSESSDHYPSPSSVLPDHSMDSLTESTKEHVEETTGTRSEPGQGNQDSKDTAREQEQKTLEERISKLISENSAVVEDKQLENVRPRKTVLSKQGSIDLPMPYTYKDSFHFDMRINKMQNVGLQRNRKPGFYNSVPTQHSMTMEHAPLTRSNSLPFSVTLLQPERSSPASPYQSDYVTLVRRGSSGQINPTGFAIKPVNQQSSTHRPLVRQTAVDCNHATDGLFKNSSVEEAGTSSLSCDGGDGGDICGEPSNRKFRRKKTQKFAYNKWYMYGGGTFKKLYDAEKGGDNSAVKGRKSLSNPEHEVIQGLQKRLSAGQKETVTITASMPNFTSNTATVCHPGCPPTRLPLVSGVDFNLKSTQFHSSCSSLRMPLRRNLSLSTLPLPSIGSLVTHTTDSISRTETVRVINEEKHTDSTSQLGGAHIPSDRKKQRTDDKIVCPQEMETDPNTLTHPPPSVTGSVPQQDTNLSYINIQTNQTRTQLKAALFPACIINANAPSASTSPATSMPSAAKTSFLPKYQLKLPNAPESDSSPSPQVGNKLTGSDGSNFTSALPSSTVKTLPSVTKSEKQRSDPITSPLMLPCVANFGSTQLIVPSTATIPACQANTSRLSQKATSSPAVSHKLFAATTKTTTCLHDYQAGLCSTLIESSPLKTAVQLPKLVAAEVEDTPATSPATTEHNQSSPVSSTVVSQAQENLPSHTNASTSGQSSRMNGATACSNSPLIPCHIVPFDSGQPAAQNVFHVHTADLQICLQIISDEQLALIEPQIERQAGNSLSQACEMEVITGGTQNKAQSFVTAKSTNEGRDCEQLGLQKEINQSKSLPTLNMDNIKPPVSVNFENTQPNIRMTQATAESESPEVPALSIRPHKYSHINMIAEPRNYAEVMSTAASLKGVKSGRSQTSEKEHALSVNCSAEEQLLPDRMVSQGGLIPQTPSGQHKLCPANMNCISFSSEKESESELPIEESQHKLRNQGGLCSASKMKSATYQSSRSENEDTCSFAHVEPGQAFSAACTNELSWSASSLSISNGRTPRQLNKQASIYCSNPEECTSETLNSSKHANMGCEKVLDSPALSQETTLSKSEDVISSAPSEQQPAQVTSKSCNIQVEPLKDIPSVLTSIPNPNAGLREGDSLAGCAAQKEPQTQGHGEAPGQPDSTDWRPKQSQDAGETNQQCTEGQGSNEEEKNGGMSMKTDKVPGQSENCRYIVLSDMMKPEGEDRKADSFQNSLLSAQHLQHLSQTNSGMSECPPQSPQQVPSMSNNLNLPANSSQTGLFNFQQPLLEVGNFCLSQQWESSTDNQQVFNSSRPTDDQPQSTETHKAIPHTEPGFQQIFSHLEQKQEDTKTDFSPSVQHGDDNSAATSCSNKSTLGSHRNLLSDVKTTSSKQISQISPCVQIHTVLDELTGETHDMNDVTLLDNNTVRPFKTFIYTEPDDNDRQGYSTQSGTSGRADIANKYQSFFLAGQLHSYQPVDCLTGVVRPVQSCQDYTEDTSSSDDEGKLIIEL